MFTLKKKPVQHSESSQDFKERLFFHDVVNQTHGLLLFLNQKEISGENINREEIQLMQKEVKTLQSLIRDHFNYKHKNLVQTYDWVPFSYAKLAFENLSQTYFKDTQVNATFTIVGKDSEEDLIYYPCFYRILNNLIKNISEAQSPNAEFNFVMDEVGLTVVTRNQLKKSSTDSSESLTRVILNEDKLIKGLGLDSIHHLAEEHGGIFGFEIENNTWINKLYLPTQNSMSLRKTDKIAA
ncbi:GHKL domain-containing protein [Bacteriovorax sp. PP10]|uniref:GHKL domain-containing protein n=1 Tax=Bacteriovorax antarcticus TaxID=3088717 RepID=A0ABU5VZW9_9BACT|nr:GHKL domain-containing protein [Bacteriovorax sp. PP10]MEA9358546.1 GHKL domain-containing protein [Bacteriovorax sp. PP10]